MTMMKASEDANATRAGALIHNLLPKKEAMHPSKIGTGAAKIKKKTKLVNLIAQKSSFGALTILPNSCIMARP